MAPNGHADPIERCPLLEPKRKTWQTVEMTRLTRTGHSVNEGPSGRSFDVPQRARAGLPDHVRRAAKGKACGPPRAAFDKGRAFHKFEDREGAWH
jgi:hypothetical protein